MKPHWKQTTYKLTSIWSNTNVVELNLSCCAMLIQFALKKLTNSILVSAYIMLLLVMINKLPIHIYSEIN